MPASRPLRQERRCPVGTGSCAPTGSCGSSSVVPVPGIVITCERFGAKRRRGGLKGSRSRVTPGSMPRRSARTRSDRTALPDQPRGRERTQRPTRGHAGVPTMRSPCHQGQVHPCEDCPGQRGVCSGRIGHQKRAPLKSEKASTAMLALSGVRVRSLSFGTLGFRTPGTPERTADLKGPGRRENRSTIPASTTTLCPSQPRHTSLRHGSDGGRRILRPYERRYGAVRPCQSMCVVRQCVHD